jgi:hypothetical protein
MAKRKTKASNHDSNDAMVQWSDGRPRPSTSDLCPHLIGSCGELDEL